MPENKDTISREEAKNALCRLCRDISNWRMCERNDECNFICRIDGVPAADVRPVVRGKWILKDDGRAHCSMCDTPGNSYVWNFCPNCGADMREANDGT